MREHSSRCSRHLPIGLITLAAFIVFVVPSSAEGLAGPALPAGGKFNVVERSDLRKYENGKYVGLENREVKGILDWTEVPDGKKVEGTFYVIGELNRGGAPVAMKIDAAFPAAWTIRPNGQADVEADTPYPLMRGFPLIPTGPLAPGDSWRAPGECMVEPLRDGKFTLVKFISSYRYDGDKVINGTSFRMITAKYSLGYRKGPAVTGDERLESVSGSHTVSLRISADAGALSFMSDTVEETYEIAGSRSVTYKGFVLTWFNVSAPLDSAETAKRIADALLKAGAADVGVEQKKEGVSITLNKIHFVAEQAVVLPEDVPRLEAVAETLRQVPDRSFLVIGHTAAVGTAESQQELSVQRAKAIVDFLVSRGIDARRLLYEGRGGTQPVAPNNTEENMARNRRVEILILED
jgi:OmpA-OmpF porin, OOP family